MRLFALVFVGLLLLLGLAQATPTSGCASKRVKVFLDQDTLAAGTNILSIALLLLDPCVDVVAIGVIAGDTNIDDAMYHTLQIVEHTASARRAMCTSAANDGCAPPPVAQGAINPLLNSGGRVLRSIDLFGPKGGDAWLGEWRPGLDPKAIRRIPGLQDPTISAVTDDGGSSEKKHAAQLLIEMARRYPGELVVYTAGPLTNVALAVSLAPDIVGKIKAIYVMGGAVAVKSRFNFWWDPESAAIVLRQPWLSKTLVPIDVCHQTVWTRDLLDRVYESARQELSSHVVLAADVVDGEISSLQQRSPLLQWMLASFAQPWVQWNLPMWDELAVTLLVDTELDKPAQTRAARLHERLFVDVDVGAGPHYGSTVWWNATRPDPYGGAGPWWALELGPWLVHTHIDRQAHENYFVETFGRAIAADVRSRLPHVDFEGTDSIISS